MGRRKGNNDVGFKKWKGIVTEQNIGQYEAEAAIDADNVEFLKDGTVQRRLGFEREAGGTILATLTANERSTAAFSEYLWEDINGIPGLNIRALQIGSTIKLLDDTYPVSQAALFASINLDDFAVVDGDAAGTYPCQFASGAGVMVIVNRGIEPIRVTVSNKAYPPAVVVQQQPVLIRWDRLEGTHSASELGNAQLTAGIEFDLRNTGWPFRADCSADQDGRSATIIKTDPAAYYKAKIGVWPKPSILYQALRLGNAIEPAPLGSFSPWEVDKLHVGNTIPPKGHYTTPAWSFDSRALMQAGIGGGGVGSAGWVLAWWQVVELDASSPRQRFRAVAYIKYTGTLSKGGAIKGAAALSQVGANPSGAPFAHQYGAYAGNSVLGVGEIPDFYSGTAGSARVDWTSGFSTSAAPAPGIGDGRGGFVLNSPLAYDIQLGDRFVLV